MVPRRQHGAWVEKGMGKVMFDISISQGEGMERAHRMFGGGTELGGVAATPEGHAVVQWDLDSLRIGQI